MHAHNGGPPQIIMTGGEGCIKHCLLIKNVVDNTNMYIQTQGTPHMVESMIRTVKSVFDQKPTRATMGRFFSIISNILTLICPFYNRL